MTGAHDVAMEWLLVYEMMNCVLHSDLILGKLCSKTFTLILVHVVIFIMLKLIIMEFRVV